MKKNYTLSLDTEVVRRARELCGLVSFSRYVQHLLERDVADRGGEDDDSCEHDGSTHSKDDDPLGRLASQLSKKDREI